MEYKYSLTFLMIIIINIPFSDAIVNESAIIERKTILY